MSVFGDKCSASGETPGNRQTATIPCLPVCLSVLTSPRHYHYTVLALSSCCAAAGVLLIGRQTCKTGQVPRTMPRPVAPDSAISAMPLVFSLDAASSLSISCATSIRAACRERSATQGRDISQHIIHAAFSLSCRILLSLSLIPFRAEHQYKNTNTLTHTACKHMLAALIIL